MSRNVQRACRNKIVKENVFKTWKKDNKEENIVSPINIRLETLFNISEKLIANILYLDIFRLIKIMSMK